MPGPGRKPSRAEPAPPAAVFDVKAIPRAGRSQIGGMRDGAVLVRLSAAPVDGAANAELVAAIAGALGLPRRAVTIVSGDRARRKRVRVEGMTLNQVLAMLAP